MNQTLAKNILSHAKNAYPNECCGLVVIKGRKERYVPCRNISNDPTNQFILSPEDYAEAEDTGEIVRIVHSHPDASTTPSPADIAMCNENGIPWIIASWPEGDIREVYPDDPPLIGRSWSLGTYDCWGLIMAYFKKEHGIILSDYRKTYPWWENDYSDNFYQDCWYECGFREFEGPPKPGDMIIMQVQADKWNHAGILLEGNMLLHHLYGHLSQRVPYGGYWRERTMKIVRHLSMNI
ncbi:MAG: C40 family peptidase [Kluyvera sp.]|uniref:C40 family peptidase n=1 Tax=Kluyvera sp. TaxID=1538228 RepID=UPI003F356CDF